MKRKLSKLKFKLFDRDIINCQPFWDQFNVSIYFLNEIASSSISGLTVTIESHDEAAIILEEQFDNTQILINYF